MNINYNGIYSSYGANNINPYKKLYQNQSTNPLQSNVGLTNVQNSLMNNNPTLNTQPDVPIGARAGVQPMANNVTGTQKGAGAAGIWGAIYGVARGVGDSIKAGVGKVNQTTGELENKKGFIRAEQAESFLDPYGQMKSALSDPNASSSEKWGSVANMASFGMGTLLGVGKKKAARIEAENKARIEKQQKSELSSSRLKNLAPKINYTPTFANGGPIDDGENTGYEYAETPNYKPITPRTFYLENKDAGYLPDTLNYGGKEGFSRNQLSNMPDYTGHAGSYAPYKYDQESNQYFKNFPQVQIDHPDAVKVSDAGLDVPSGQRVSTGNIESVAYKANGGLISSYKGGGDIGEPTIYKNGGTHEENKYGGIPIGNKGKVEEGEVRHGNFIFSNRF